MRQGTRRRAALDWLRGVPGSPGPLYLTIAQALEGAIRNGELQPGDQLPPQRMVADHLGVDLTTVTRAYGVARDRGLLDGAVGRGTFVSTNAADDEAGLVDLTMNLPPPPDGVSLGAMLAETSAAVLDRADPAILLAYHPGPGSFAQRSAGAAWLAPHLGSVDPERIVVAAGAQAAIAATIALLCPPGSSLVVEPLTYPGVRSAAAQAGVRLVPCPGDGQGPLPSALDAVCRAHAPTALYVVPTMQNPTATVIGLDRRRELARLARAHDLSVIEDDPYSRLLEQPLPALATLAPERTFHVSTLSKCLTPGLRIAYVAAPTAARANDLVERLRAISLMPPPLMAAVATRWIREGRADALLEGVRREAVVRRRIAHELLPGAVGSDESLHVWLPLADAAAARRLRIAAHEQGMALVSAEAFATGAEHDEGVRISLGAPGRRVILGDALGRVAALLEGPIRSRAVV